MLRISANGASRAVYARGLRNTLGWAWHPQTNELWGFDHGSDFRGNDVPPEELNLIREGGNYGWPFCYGQRVVDRWSHYDPPGMTPAAYCASTEPAALTYQAHSAPIGMVFYSGTQFPATFQGDAFVSMHGSWNRSPAAPAKVIRVRFQNGRPIGTEDFITGFLTNGGRAFIGRPAGLVVGADGSLLISDDANGAIYRVSYGNPSPVSPTGPGQGPSRMSVPMRDADGRDLGSLTIAETMNGLEISGTLRSLTPGIHGIHLHVVGQCSAPFTSAGGHWNPTQRQHGTENPQGAHYGDLQNIRVDRRGVVNIRVTSPGGSLHGTVIGGGGRLGRGRTISAPALIDADGAAIVIHAEPDDYRTDPSGNSGARVACGVLR
jgi:Cu/Zn superoxide dismutase